MPSSARGRLVLASRSPRRAQILSTAGIEFVVIPAEIDEDGILARSGDLRNAVQVLALAKARSIAESGSGSYVLGADTIVVQHGEVLGKPDSPQHAVEMLRRLSAQEHEVITGVALVNPAGDSHTKCVSTSVTFRSLDDEAIAKYVSSGLPFDKAGGYGIQDRSFAPVASYDNCYLNVVGLPMCATSELLRRSGFVQSGAIDCPGHGAPEPETEIDAAAKSRPGQ